MAKDNKFWNTWGNKEGQKSYNMRSYHHTPSYNNDGVKLHTLVFEDEDGKQIQTCFEAFKSYGSDMPVMGLRLLSVARKDSNQSISVPDWLEEAFYGQALQRLSENDHELLDEVPAW